MTEFKDKPLTEILFSNKINLPKFMFYFDCSYVSSLIKNDTKRNVKQGK